MYGGRQSERFGDLSELGAVEEVFEVDGTFINPRADGLLDQTIEGALDEDDTTTQIRALIGRRDGRPSDVNLGVFGEGEDDTEEPTFRFLIPERMRAPAQQEPQEEQGEQDEEEVASQSLNPLDDTELPESDELEEYTAALDRDDPTENGGMLGWESDPPVEDDAELAAYREEESALDRSLQTKSPEPAPTAHQRGVRKPKEFRVSQHDIGYPSFPTAPIKKLALSFMKSQGSKAQLNKDALAALVNTTDDFFEQMSIDLAAYAQHGGRKMIEESDVIALMKRYDTSGYCTLFVQIYKMNPLTVSRTRKTTDSSTSFSLAQKMLPRELLQQLRMEPPVKLKGQKRKRLNPIHEADEDND
jgi:histone H3/H4